MASRADTKALGLHGLFVEARRRGDRASAHAFAEEAARESPSLGWAGKAVLEFRCLTGDWAGALALLESNRRALDKETYRRQRAVMLTARAHETQETDRDNAKAFALEAAKLAPTFVPAAALAGRMLAEGGELRKASRVLNKAWLANPHPDLAQVLSNLRFGDAARDRLKRIEALAKKVPGHIEGALAMARAALDAREFAKARAALASYLAAPTKRIALLMAELERAERNDEGRAREWIARALNAAPDPTWTAEGHVSDRWLPVSPERPARCLRVARSADRHRRPGAGDRPGAVSARGRAAAAASEPQRPKARRWRWRRRRRSRANDAPAAAEPVAASPPPAAACRAPGKAGAGDPAGACARRSGPRRRRRSRAAVRAANGGWRKIFE